MKKNQNKDKFYTQLAFRQAEINLGSTKSNPSVGCIIVKNDSVISSGHTSLNGRPHAEANALKKKISFKNSELYVTLEPCSHYGKTPPCTNNIIKKKVKYVTFSVNDTDLRSKKIAKRKLIRKKIIVKKFILKNFANSFYESYFLQSLNKIPFIDAKLALSKDNYTINRKDKFITNNKSRNLGNFLRSKYDCLLTTSKTINDDNPQLNCRIEGLEKKTPVLVILDRFFKIKKSSNVFNYKKRKVFILITKNNPVKENFLKKKGIKIIKLIKKNNLISDLKEIFYVIKKLGFNRILVESGCTFTSTLLRHKLIKNFYLFKSSKKLLSNGRNNTSLLHIKKIRISQKNKIKVNLIGDSLYKVKL